MSKGIKAHLLSTLLYLIVPILVSVDGGIITDPVVKLFLVLTFISTHLGIGIICYLEGWYKK